MNKNSFMLRNLLLILVVLSILTVSCRRSALDNQEERVVDQLDQIVFPIDGASPSLGHGGLGCLDFLADARIIGLGEATHGTKEFFQMKHRIFKYLVEVHGFKAFGFEADFAESLFFEKYITTGEGNLEELMKTKMHFWTWRTEEVRDLLEWMKNYNQGKATEDQVHYFGFDCQVSEYYPGMILEYVRELVPDLEGTWQGITGDDTTGDDTSAALESFASQLESFYNLLEERNHLFAGTPDHNTFEILKRLVRVFLQIQEVKFNNEKAAIARDKYMAENAVWIADFFGKHAKIAVWGHNYHVKNDELTMGGFLRSQLGGDYRIVGFSFGRGAFTAKPSRMEPPQRMEISSEPIVNSTNRVFLYARPYQYILRMDDIPPGSELDAWVNESNYFLEIGALYNDPPARFYELHQLRMTFNVIIHFDETSNSILIPENE